MNSVTDHLRRNLADRLPRTQPKPVSSSEPPDEKFMLHFETLNRTSATADQVMPNKEAQFAQTIADYSSRASKIEQILQENEDAGPITPHKEQMAEAPKVANLRATSYQQIRQIQAMFLGQEQKENKEFINSTLLVVETYSQCLADLGRRDRARENMALAKSKAILKDATYAELEMKEIQTDPPEWKFTGQVRRKDLILMELLRQKKRRAFAHDYFATMELKLLELLDFILLDQDEYYRLDPEIKIKRVLQNLESFQGRTVEGQSKINLLRIFFEEFTALKRDKEEQEQLAVSATPVRRVNSKEKARNDRTGSTKPKESREKHTTPQRKMTKTQVSESRRGEKKQKQVGNDHWIGSL